MPCKTPIASMAEDWPLLVQQEDLWALELSEEVYEVMRKKITEPRGKGRLGREATAEAPHCSRDISNFSYF